MMLMKNLVVISGISGAGKTTASNILEDSGYLCIDQYPPELFKELLDLIKNDTTSKYENVVLTISLMDLEKYATLIRNSDIKIIKILIDCDREVVINRYKFTRRIHPLLVSNIADSLDEAIDIEKETLKKYEKGAIVIDTTRLSMKQHRERLNEIIGGDKKDNNLSISFVSFGYKNGIPDDGDTVFDVRFLDNPFYEVKLKNKTGNDKLVKKYVLSSKKTQRYLKKLIDYIDYMLKNYDDNNEKRHLTICVGCTGGQHRSVVIANYLFDYYKEKYVCYKEHREIEKWKI